MEQLESVDQVRAVLATTGYLADDAVATVAYLASALDRPLLLEGEPGTGKTALAESLAEGLGLPLVRLQCYEGIDATQALYDWDFPRQILHLRAVEALAAQPDDVAQVESELFDERFLLDRPVLRALRTAPCVLLIDEIDRADDEFEAFLLEVLSTWSVSIPEVGTVRAGQPPLALLTSNRTRELHDALKRRCLYHWIDHPSLERELDILRSRLPDVPDSLARQVVSLIHRIRNEVDVIKTPGVAETLDWARSLHALGTDTLTVETAATTLGAAIKYREDAQQVRASLERLVS